MDIDEHDVEPLYVKATNIKRRDITKDVTNTSTSSNTEKTSSSSSKEDTNNIKKKNESISTSNSRRKYNKKGITIQTN